MLTTRQVAEQLAVPVSKVTAWIRTGQLMAIDVSLRPGCGKARYRIMPEELDRFISARTQHVPRKTRRKPTKKYTYM